MLKTVRVAAGAARAPHARRPTKTSDTETD